MLAKINFKLIQQSDSELHQNCLRCGRKLKTEEARMLGDGPICHEKILEMSNKQFLLFEEDKEVQNAKK